MSARGFAKSELVLATPDMRPYLRRAVVSRSIEYVRRRLAFSNSALLGILRFSPSSKRADHHTYRGTVTVPETRRRNPTSPGQFVCPPPQNKKNQITYSPVFGSLYSDCASHRVHVRVIQPIRTRPPQNLLFVTAVGPVIVCFP